MYFSVPIEIIAVFRLLGVVQFQCTQYCHRTGPGHFGTVLTINSSSSVTVDWVLPRRGEGDADCAQTSLECFSVRLVFVLFPVGIFVLVSLASVVHFSCGRQRREKRHLPVFSPNL